MQDYDGRDEAVAESFPSSDPPANGNDRPVADDGGPSYVEEAASVASTVKSASATHLHAGGRHATSRSTTGTW